MIHLRHHSTISRGEKKDRGYKEKLKKGYIKIVEISGTYLDTINNIKIGLEN